MFDTKAFIDRTRTMPAVREALDHALTYGDDVTASELAVILQDMMPGEAEQPRGIDYAQASDPRPRVATPIHASASHTTAPR